MTATRPAPDAASPSPDLGHVDRHLAEVGRDIRAAMLDALPAGEPHEWLYRLIREYPARPGKALRPALCLAAYEAFGGQPPSARPVAVAIELLHNAFLVHDDIADGSEQRRGRPTLPAEYGVGLALNAGDALVVLAYRLIRRHARSLPTAVGDRLLDEFDAMAMRTLEGQATELGWREAPLVDLGPPDYLDLIMRKTCWYTTIHPLRVGALLGSGGTADLKPLIKFGFHLGAAFQIRDDLLNLVGDESVYGKEINGDLYEGKRTLILIHAVSAVRAGNDAAERALVDRYLAASRSGRPPDLVGAIRELIDRHGSVEFAASYADGIASQAEDAFDEAFDRAEGAPKEFIRALIPYMLGRTV